MSGTGIGLIVAMAAATFLSLLLTALDAISVEIGMTAVSVFAGLGLWLAKKGSE